MKKPIPFTIAELKIYAEKLNIQYRKIKKLQLTEIKTTTIEAISNLLVERRVLKIVYRYVSFSGLFINLNIEKVDEYPIMVSYTIRNKSFDSAKFTYGQVFTLTINKMFIPQKHDQGTFPELDSIFL
jgi:hypothetical protein